MTRRAGVVWTAVAVGGLVVAAVAVLLWLAERPVGDSGQPLAAIRSAAAASVGTDSPDGSAIAPSGNAPSADQNPGPAAVPVPPPAVRDADPVAVAAALAPAAAPTRVEVSSLGIDAVVDAVGVEPDGSMTIPRSASRVGWYRYGSAPGDAVGNTVLAGHVDTAADGPGALFRLRDAEVGTIIAVTDATGTRREYEVKGTEDVVKAALPVEEIFARDGRPLLVLVTCGGDFQPALRSYTDNLVVTAVPATGGA